MSATHCAFRPLGTCCYVRFPVPLGCRAFFGAVLGGCSEQFARESLYWRGRVLTGEHGHWCEDWDGLPIDETCGDDEGNGEWPCACNVGREWLARRTTAEQRRERGE